MVPFRIVINENRWQHKKRLKIGEIQNTHFITSYAKAIKPLDLDINDSIK